MLLSAQTAIAARGTLHGDTGFRTQTKKLVAAVPKLQPMEQLSAYSKQRRVRKESEHIDGAATIAFYPV
jgi:hypothetical protein